MARIYLRGETWWCWGYDVNGKRWSESTKQKDRAAAKLAARELERRYAASPDYGAKARLTLERALLMLLGHLESAGRAKNTIRAAEYHCRHLVTWLDRGMPLADIRLAHTTDYMLRRIAEGASKHLVAKELKTLTQSMRRAAKLGMFVMNFDPRSLMPDELGRYYVPRDRWLTRDEYNALLARLSPNRQDYVAMWCHTGLRLQELFDVRPTHYDQGRRLLRVFGTKTEGSARMVPLNDIAHVVLERRSAGGVAPFPEWGKVCRDLARACARASIQKVTPNDLRRTFCSWMCQAGVPEMVCADLLGHEDTTMVRAVYGHLDHVTRADAVARVVADNRDSRGQRGPHEASMARENPGFCGDSC